MAISDPHSVTDRLKDLRQRAGLSMAAIAKACGYRGASSYQRYENAELYGDTYLPLKLVRALVPALTGRGAPPIKAEEVMALAGVSVGEDGEITQVDLDPRPESAAPARPRGRPAPPADAGGGRPVAVPAVADMPRDVPVIGNVEGGADGSFVMNGERIDVVRRPPGVASAIHAFALYVVGTSMSPRYEEGDLIYVHPDRPPRPGDDVVIELHGTAGEAGRSYIKRLVRRGGRQVTCRQFNPDREVNYETRDIRRIYRILTAAELLGV